MKHHGIPHILIAGITLLLLVVFPTFSIHAASDLALLPEEGEVGDRIDIEGQGFTADGLYRIYFSSEDANAGQAIGSAVKAYEGAGIITADPSGDIDANFKIPAELTDGIKFEYVHGGTYYFYLTQHGSTTIVAVAEFTVIGGEIEISSATGHVGDEIEINGIRFGAGQNITVRYDGDKVAITGGDTLTDENGDFTTHVVIPDSLVGAHTITVIDEWGNEPELEFTVAPKLTLDPATAASGDTVNFTGGGFGDREFVTILVDDYRVPTTPISIQANSKGSFAGSFIVPGYVSQGTSEIRATDGTNAANADLTISTGLTLDPAISQDSPGYAGMELMVQGSGFKANTPVTIAFDASPIATETTNHTGGFAVNLTIPSGVAGSHTITATDGTTTTTATFIMEAETPPIPVPLLPAAATTTDTTAVFSWGSVADASGVTYTLQVGADPDFTTTILDKSGLEHPAYTLSIAEGLEPTAADAPYYWRVKAVDGAANEGKWTVPISFYVSQSAGATLGWTLYLWIGIGVIVLGILGFFIVRKARG